MRVTHVRVAGFKSFVEPVELRIEAGLTGIVGPNGCGKSNILESLRWVMGATSAKALRGGEMDDVIFAGTDQRPARDIAEVTLVLDNGDGRAPPPFQGAPTLEVSRKIKRGAGSTFKINGKEVRARDVQLLFADASTGANSPALVRQNQVSELINAKPENRRRILEEAAGIAGLYARRHEAELKLSGAQANLERLDDVILAMEEQLSSLRRQAKQAARYRALAQDIRGLETFLFAKRLVQAEQALTDAKDASARAQTALADATLHATQASKDAEASEDGLTALREEQMIADAVLRRLDGQKFGLERDLKAAEDAITGAKAELVRIGADLAREGQLKDDATSALARIEADIAGLDEESAGQADMAAKTQIAEGLFAQLHQAEGRYNEALAQRAQLASQREAQTRACADAKAQAARRHAALLAAQDKCNKLTAELPSDAAITEAQSALAHAQERVAQARAAADTLEKEADDAREQEAGAREQARVSQNLCDRLLSEIAALKATSRKMDKAQGPKALDTIVPKPGYERAIGAAFGDDLEAGLSASDPIAWTQATGPDWDADTSIWPDRAVVLADAVLEAPPQLQARLLATACVSPEQFEAGAQLARGLRLVTQAGDMRRWDGFVRRAHALSSNAAVLEQRTRLMQLEAQLPDAQQDAQMQAEAAARARARTDQARANAKNARTALPATLLAVDAARDQLLARQSETQRATLMLEQAKEALAGIQVEHEQACALVEVTEALLAQLPPGQDESGALAQLQEELTRTRAEANQAHLDLSLIQNQLNARATQRKALLGDKEAWTRRIAQADARLQALNESQNLTQARLQQAEAAPTQIEETRRALLSKLPAAHARKSAADDALVAREGDIRRARERTKIAQSALSDAREAHALAQSRLEAADARVQELGDDIVRTLQIAPEDCLTSARVAMGAEFDALTPKQGESQLAKLLYDRDALGGVNLRAEEEADAQANRLLALISDKNDLGAAIAKLRGGVAQINSEGKARLEAAFEIVHAHFKALFSTLFDGGVSELRLTQSDDPLGGGLEVYACPPGKKLQSLSLMSGGEQALTASALIFAVFLSNPSPICVLDEVDAPLDDSNVDRYCTLLEEMRARTQTRFIVITHHPITMARMDRLFGVTMAERGVSQIVSVDLSRAEALIAQA